MNIILYDDRYRDDMLTMIREARVALGLAPSVRADLYDVKANYLDKGDGFWLALDEDGRVIGCLGWSRTEKQDEAFLHRFYVKADRKRRGSARACSSPPRPPCARAASAPPGYTWAAPGSSGTSPTPFIPRTAMRRSRHGICKSSCEPSLCRAPGSFPDL